MKFNKKITIEKFQIHENSRTFVIAEAGVNHNGNLDLAKKLIDVAATAGADAVKFQTFIPESLILSNVEKAPYQKRTTGEDKSQLEMLKELALPIEAFVKLQRYAKSKNIIFLTTAFDEKSLDMLDALRLPAYKIASTDTTNLPLLKKFAKKGKPLILSTAMSYMEEVVIALEEIYPYNKDVILLQCTGNYPPRDEEANLKVITTYKERFDMLVGYSDHTVDIGASPYAVSMGAKVIEKHFTLDKSMIGPDHKASLSPVQLGQFITQIRKVEEYLGSPIKMPVLAEEATRKSLQKCLVATRNIKKGKALTEKDFIAKRTGGKGISPMHYKELLGKPVPRDFKKNEIIEL